MSTRENAEMIRENTELDISLNTILYGPPGTGKTYHTVIYAVAVIENRSLASVEREDYEEKNDHSGADSLGNYVWLRLWIGEYLWRL